MSALLAAGFSATNDLGQIDLYSRDVGAAIFDDGFESGATAGWSSTQP